MNEMKLDSKGNKISIGDRVRVLWGFDNKIHTGEVTDINDRAIRIDTINRRIITVDSRKINKIS
jgi:small-conductance mechanosensitive channel